MRKNFLSKGNIFILLAILIASLTLGLNVKPVQAQEIVDVISPTQVRVNDNFWVTVEVHYEVDGPITLNFEVQILEETTGDPQGDLSIGGTFPAGHHVGERFISVGLNAPGSPLPAWELRAVLAGGNEWSFSVEVVGEETPPTIHIEGLEADPSVPYVGDRVDLVGWVDYTIPEGSRFEIRYTTSYGIPTLFEPTSFMGSPKPWVTLSEGGTRDWGPFGPYRAGDEEGIVPGSGADPIQIPANVPLEPGDWVWYLRIVYIDPDGVEVEHGSRELSVEVVARTDAWAAIDNVWGELAVPGLEYTIMFDGRYFMPEGEVHDIRVEIWDRDTSAPVPGDSERNYPGLAGSGILLENFNALCPPTAVGSLILAASIWMDGIMVDSKDFVAYISTERLFNVEINVPAPPPEVAYGSSLDLEVLLDWELPPLPDTTEIEVSIWQPGIGFPLATEYIEGSDSASGQPLAIKVPSEYVPPRDGEWVLEAGAYATPEGTSVMDYSPFTVNVIGAGEGIVGGSSDWMVVDGWPSISTPFEGVGLRFWAIIQVDTVDPLPQQVWLTLDLDGSEVVREALVYLPDMDYYAFQSASLWTATPGEHIAFFHVDPDGDYTDPDLDNNEFLFRFTVEEAPPPFIPVEGEEPPPPEEEFNFYVSATPTERTLASSVSYTVAVELSSGEPEEVQLSLLNAPAGLSYAFKPSSGLPPYTSELTVTGSRDLRAAAYFMMINATGGEKERYKPIILRVEEGADYELSASPRTLQAEPGETVEYTISASSDTGYSQYVNLAVSDLPSGLTSRLGSSAGIPDFRTTLYVDVGGDVSPRAYSITVTGSGPEPKRVTVTLDVREPVSEEPREGDQSTIAYYLPLVYLIAIIAAIIAGVVLGIRRLRGEPRKRKAFCIECGKKIPLGIEFCPKCGVKQKE